jgi:hypothetical protein
MTYTVFLHKAGADPKTGYGYKAEDEAEVRARAEEWNNYTLETCPHKAFLDGEACKLCGNRYEVTVS